MPNAPKSKTAAAPVVSGLNDSDLVHSARLGDKLAFVEIVSRYQAMVCGVALSILGDFAASEDAAQETFLIAWNKISELREPAKLRSWLAQIARNAALTLARKRRDHFSIDDIELPEIRDRSPAPDDAAAAVDELNIVRSHLSKLPEIYRLPLILYYREGQSVRAVAKSLDITEDAVKQRLARGREMLHQQLSGLIKTVLQKTAPSATFTLAVATAIGALLPPLAVANAAFSMSASKASRSTFTGELISTFNGAKGLLLSIVLATICIPTAYFSIPALISSPSPASDFTRNDPESSAHGLADVRSASPLIAAWNRLHELHGTNAAAMPRIYQEIETLHDPFHQLSLKAALMAEWAGLDPDSGLDFYLQKVARERNQYFRECLSLDSNSAIAALLKNKNKCEELARHFLVELARKSPANIPQIAAFLPKPEESFWNTEVRDAFETLAASQLDSTRAIAENFEGENRDQVLAGVAKAWGKTDFPGAVAWARSLSQNVDKDEIVRAALLGLMSVDPIRALENIRLVPPGGAEAYFATSTGARILSEVAKIDYDLAERWIGQNPGKIGREDILGIADAVTLRLNNSPGDFLTHQLSEGLLDGFWPAIQNALLNRASGQNEAFWDWIKLQPEEGAIPQIKSEFLMNSFRNQKELAIKIASELEAYYETKFASGRGSKNGRAEHQSGHRSDSEIGFTSRNQGAVVGRNSIQMKARWKYIALLFVTTVLSLFLGAMLRSLSKPGHDRNGGKIPRTPNITKTNINSRGHQLSLVSKLKRDLGKANGPTRWFHWMEAVESATISDLEKLTIMAGTDDAVLRVIGSR